MPDLKTATINSRNKLAVSIQYDGTGAPKVTAKGSGYIAQAIIESAEKHGVPIQENTDLVGLLSQVELNQEIPEVLFEAVAQILVFAYQLSGKEIPGKPKTQKEEIP